MVIRCFITTVYIDCFWEFGFLFQGKLSKMKDVWISCVFIVDTINFSCFSGSSYIKWTSKIDIFQDTQELLMQKDVLCPIVYCGTVYDCFTNSFKTFSPNKIYAYTIGPDL